MMYRKANQQKVGPIMNSEWQTFLNEAGAVFEDGRLLHFGEPATEPEAAVGSDILADLSHFGLIAVTGDDAPEFLQNQFSNDVRQVDETHSQLSAHCTPKGRVMNNFRLFSRDGAYYLRMAKGLLEPALKSASALGPERPKRARASDWSSSVTWERRTYMRSFLRAGSRSPCAMRR